MEPAAAKTNTPAKNHGLRNVPHWERMSERKRARVAAKEAVAAVSDMGTDFRRLMTAHNELVDAHNELKRGYNALRMECLTLRDVVLEQMHTHGSRRSWGRRFVRWIGGFIPTPRSIYEHALNARYEELQRVRDEYARAVAAQREAERLLSIEDAIEDAKKRTEAASNDGVKAWVQLYPGTHVSGFITTPPQIRAAHLVIWHLDAAGERVPELYPLEDIAAVSDDDGNAISLTEGDSTAIARKEADDVTTDSETKQQGEAEQSSAAPASN